MTSGAFSGAGSAWFDRQNLRDTFIEALRAFPISSDSPPEIESGFWSKEHRGTLEQCHLRIVIRPYDTRGTLLVHVDLTTESWTSKDKDKQQSVTTRFLVEYAAVETFASEFEQVLGGQRRQATLAGSIG